jgi:uncharacterized OsmC-like protein
MNNIAFWIATDGVYLKQGGRRMAEKVIIRQKRNFETEIQALDPQESEGKDFFYVEDARQLTPYGMLLTSLGACTAIVVNTYAQNHGVDLQEVELHLTYSRDFNEDCENCTEIEKYEEHIDYDTFFRGDLSEADIQRLFQVSRACSIHKMLEDGVQIDSRLGEREV